MFYIKLHKNVVLSLLSNYLLFIAADIFLFIYYTGIYSFL